MTTSASLPTSSEPTRESIRSCFAGFIVTSAMAWSSFMSPQRTDLAASVLRRRACSALSELMETVTPLAVMIDALPGMASSASIL
jgi:hypothetical protein